MGIYLFLCILFCVLVSFIVHLAILGLVICAMYLTILVFNIKLLLILQVTLINNLELYGINIQEFARECQHGVAASTSISPVPGKKSLQLLVQGNQVLFVGNLLMGMLKCERNDGWFILRFHIVQGMCN